MKYIKVGKGENQKTYTEEDLAKMSSLELKQLKQELQIGIENISVKISKYRNENTESKNSHEYWAKINTYKAVMNMLKQAIFIAGKYEKEANIKTHKSQERWLYCYYMASKTLLSAEMVKDIEALATQQTGLSGEIA